MLIKLLFFFLGSSLYFGLYGQEATLFGHVKDSAGTALPNANIIAFPKDERKEAKFAISRTKGEYSIKLDKNHTYRIEISYLGYDRQILETTLSQNKEQDFVLMPKAYELGGVELQYDLPVSIKTDTITYNVDFFAKGHERKVRELLKNLPGIEVDFEGNVRAQGEKITKVLVEGDEFFTGDSKMAVNNIPANVVGQIEIIDNYSEIGFMGGFSDSYEKAMNIKLKEDKKRFVFGEVEMGGGVRDRYIFHPTLFYYGPQTTFNLIGNIGNLEAKGFTYQDYLDFEGKNKFLAFDGPTILKFKIDNDVSDFLGNRDNTSYRDNFVALSIKQRLGPAFRLNTFLIADKSVSSTIGKSTNEYMNNAMSIVETRNQTDKLSGTFSLGKSSGEYRPSDHEILRISLYYKYSNNSKEGELSSLYSSESSLFASTNKNQMLRLNPNIDYNKKFSLAQSLSASFDWAFENNDIQRSWSSDSLFLENYLPLLGSNPVLAVMEKGKSINSLQIGVKDYWVLNSKNHIYTTLGYTYKRDVLSTKEGQLMEEDVYVDFLKNGFGNNIDYLFQDVLLGLEYKFLLKKLTGRFSIHLHHYSWHTDQNSQRVSHSINQALPGIKLDYKFKSGQFLRFQYRKDIVFPKVDELGENYDLMDFNSVYRGNPNLMNEWSNNYSLSFRKFNFLKGTSFNILANHQYRRQNIKNETYMSGIDQQVRPINLDMPELSFTGLINLSKRIKSFRYTLRSNIAFNEFRQLVNSDIIPNSSLFGSFMVKTESLFDAFPNFEIQYSTEPSEFRTSHNKFEFSKKALLFKSNFHHRGLKINADYTRSLFKNKTLDNKSLFDIANLSIGHKKEDSPWYCEVALSNIYDVKYKRTSSISDVFITDNRVYIFPRTIVFKIAYDF